jgi:hypothetical protein
MPKKFPQADALKAQLEQLGSDYLCSSRLPATSVSVSFLGPYQGRIVMWKMNLATLSHYRQAVADAIAAPEQERFICPFIEIKEDAEGVYRLNVGLELPAIDEPVIKKTLIMIRNYRLLAVGKIEFGTANT